MGGIPLADYSVPEVIVSLTFLMMFNKNAHIYQRNATEIDSREKYKIYSFKHHRLLSL